MSTEQGEGSASQKAATQRSGPKQPATIQSAPIQSTQTLQQPASAAQEADIGESSDDKKPAAKPSHTSQSAAFKTPDERKQAAKPRIGLDPSSESTSPSTPDDPAARPRQVIAVSASKGPAAFFNLARKFLVTDETCDLSALEGAIVSAVDAAHLLERSKLATIVRVQTSYVTVEPKRRKQAPDSPVLSPSASVQGHTVATQPGDPALLSSSQPSPRGRTSTGRELRRARIVITVKRTESYKQWLEDNPLQAIIAGDGGDDEEGVIEGRHQQES